MPTTAQAKKAWEHGRKSQEHYNALTTEQKSAFWYYGRDNGLVDRNNLDEYKAKEYDSYVFKKDLQYAPNVYKNKDLETTELKANPDNYSSNVKTDKYANYTGPTVSLDKQYSFPKVEPKPTAKPLPKVPTKGTKVETKNENKMVPVGKAGILKTQARNFSNADAMLLGAIDTTTLGAFNKQLKDDSIKDHDTAFKAGQIGGYLAPYGAATKAVKPLVKGIAKPILRNVAEGAVVGGGVQALQNTLQGKSLKDNAKETGAGLILGGVIDGTLPLVGKVAKMALNNIKIGRLSKLPISEVATTLDNAPTLKTTNINSNGKFKVKNTVMDKAINEYNSAIETIQNYFKTNDLTTSEMSRIKPELGIDLDNIVRNIEKAENVNVSTIGKNRNMANVAGVKQLPNIKPSIIPKALDNINTQPIVNKALKPNLATQEVATTLENADTFMAKINVKPKKKAATGLGLKMRTDLVDKLAPLENVEKAVRGKVDSAEKSLYKTARNYFGTPEKAHEIVRTQLEPTLKAVQKQGYDIKELAAYAEAVHAKDVNAAGIKSGFTDAEINDVIAKYGALEPQRLELQKLNNFVLDELVNGEVISKEAAAAMKDKWKNYMPLFRVMEDDKVEFGKGVSQTFANVGNPIKTLKGSDKDVIDPIESMIKNVFQGINAAERNKVGLQLANLALDDVDGAFIRKLSDSEVVGRKNVLNIKQAGQNVKYEVNPELYKAMLGLDKESSSLMIKMLSKPAGLLRAGATLTPEFAARNPMRDVLNAYITSKSGFNPFTDFARGLASAIKKDDLYTKFITSNGAYGESISMDRNMHREILEKSMKTPSKHFVDIVSGKSLIKVLRAISDTTEKATKIGEFNKALKQGQTVEEAAYRARDLMDFARSGNSIKEANKVVAFLNANIQGKSKFIRSIKEDPIGVTARIGKAIALPSIAVFTAQQTLANDEQKAIIQDAPDWLRDTFWLIPIPGTNQIARVPKPFDFAVFGNTIERFLAYTVNDDKEAFDNFARSTIKQQSIPVMLTGLAPILEGVANYSAFRDAPIVPQREANLERKDQFDTYTSELSKKIAGGLTPILGEDSNFTSPRIVDNTIRGLTAGMGGYALDVFDIILGKETQKPAKNVSQMPLLKGFLVNENSSGKSMEALYDDKDKLTREKNSAKLNKMPFTNQQGLKQATTIADRVGDITKQIREITNSKTLSPEQKRVKINELTDIRNRLTREYNQRK